MSLPPEIDEDDKPEHRNQDDDLDHNEICIRAGALLIYAHRHDPATVQKILAILRGENVRH